MDAMKKTSCWVYLASVFGISAQKLVLCLFDLLALLGTALVVFLVRAAFGGLDPVLYHWVAPMLLLGPVLGAGLGLYQTVSLAPHRELKALFQLTSLLYAIILAVLFLSKTAPFSFSVAFLTPPTFPAPAPRKRFFDPLPKKILGFRTRTGRPPRRQYLARARLEFRAGLRVVVSSRARAFGISCGLLACGACG